MTDMIPVSEINSVMNEIRDSLYRLNPEILSGVKPDILDFCLGELQKIKQKAIPAISIEKIDEKIKSFERLVENPDHLGNEHCGTCSTFMQIIKALKDLKNDRL